MKSNNFELALQRFEISSDNDTISFENHYFNGFSGAEGAEAYSIYLESLHNDYFLNLRTHIDVLVLQNIETALKFMQTKITLFNEIQNEFELKSTLEFWISNKQVLNEDMKQKINEYPLYQKLKKQRDTVDFFINMIKTQNYFIDKTKIELLKINNIYSPKTQQQTITEQQIDKDNWNNILKDKPDILTTFDLAEFFRKDQRTINRWVKEGVIIPIDKSKRPQQFKKDDVKRYYLKLRK